MIKASLQITGLKELLEVHPKAVDGVKVIARDMAKETAKAQEQAIYAGSAPGGGPQKAQAESTESRKTKTKTAPNVPLYRTGVLADSSRWKVSKTKTGASLKPPKERQAAVRILMATGFRLVFNSDYPRELTRKAEAKLEKLAKEL
jgi:hypothetical protein